MKSWFEIKIRTILGPDEWDDKEVVILGKYVKWGQKGVGWEADPKHRKLVLESVGLGEKL
eukprot:12411678-Karenia_brevis.AAC.1